MDPEYKVLQPPPDFDYDALAPPISFPMEPGDALIFTNFTLHRSLMNNAETTRWSIDLRFATGPVGEVGTPGGVPGFRVGESSFESWQGRVEEWRGRGGDSNFGARLQAVGVPTLTPSEYERRQAALAAQWAAAQQGQEEPAGSVEITKLRTDGGAVAFQFEGRWGVFLSAEGGLRLLWAASEQAALQQAAAAADSGPELAIEAPAWVDAAAGLRWPVVVQHPQPFSTIFLVYCVVSSANGGQQIALLSTNDFVAFHDQGSVFSPPPGQAVHGPPTIVSRDELWHLLYPSAGGELLHVAAPSPTGFVPSEGEGRVSRRVARPARRVVGAGGPTAVRWLGDMPAAVSIGAVANL